MKFKKNLAKNLEYYKLGLMEKTNIILEIIMKYKLI